MDFYDTGIDFIPNLSTTACINRRFDQWSETEVNHEQKVLKTELQNALWHRGFFVNN